MSRPGMVDVLKYLRTHTHDDYVVIFDDLKRFARDTEFHIRLRKQLAAYNATVECLNFRFEDTPEGRFVETVIAASGELERLENRRQTLQRCGLGWNAATTFSRARLAVVTRRRMGTARC